MQARTFLRAAITGLASIALSACVTTSYQFQLPPGARQYDPKPEHTTAVPLTGLVEQVDIPFETFTLDNGLTTIVHTDRKAPIVGVTVYYRVGSKSEPRGRTGFAHLYEHIMFGGSENVENFDVAMEAAGSTPTNGSTSYDRTNYVQTVPTGALDLALFLESDRMGHLLGAVTQERLDDQRGVVQNEKRQSDIEPFGLVDYRMNERLLPVGHPYRHSVIGSMADLDAASLADVQTWFADNYAPNNVVLSLAGDIDVATARVAVERWFGDIPRGPDVVQQEAGPVTLDAPIEEVMEDQVTLTRVYRAWTGPGMNDPDAIPLEVGMHILGGLYSSRLDNALVYGDELANSVYAYSQTMEQLSFITAMVDISPNANPEGARAEFFATIDRLVEEGPTEEEVRRAATQIISSHIIGLEGVGGFNGKGATLAEGLLYTGNAGYYRTYLNRVASLTPEEIQAAMQRWLSRPAYTLTVVPGERSLDGALMGGWGDEDSVPPPAPDNGNGDESLVARSSGVPREAPPVLPVPALDFPEIERATLSNGIPVTLARRETVPTVTMALTVDAGSAVDSLDEAGRHELMVDMLEQGTPSRSPLDIVIEQEELGGDVTVWTGVDSSRLFMSSLNSNFPRMLDLMADMVLNPLFHPETVSRLRSQRINSIREERTQPNALANRAMGRLLYGDRHPYAMASTIGDLEVVSRLNSSTLEAEHNEWFRPDLAHFTVVGDISMEELLAALETSFAGWKLPDEGRPKKELFLPIPTPQSRLVVVDRPNSPQSYLMLGRVLPLRGTDGTNEALQLANEVIGNGFLSRLNADLRETRGWTYSVASMIPERVGRQSLLVATQVQADRTGESIQVILDQMAAFPSTRPVDEVELQRVTEGNIRGLPNRYETNGHILGALLLNEQMGRQEDYQESLADRYRAVDAEAINAAAAEYLQPDDLTIVVVGDRSVIDEQIAELGTEVIYLDADSL